LVVPLLGERPISKNSLLLALNGGVWRERLGGCRMWGALRPGWQYLPLTNPALLPSELATLTLCWELTELAGDSLTEMTQEVEMLLYAARDWASLFQRTPEITETPREVVLRAARLIGLKGRFARTIEMHLRSIGRPFPARTVWRAAYALGMTWGNLDLLHWHDPVAKTPLFTLSALGEESYFLPERAAEGGGVPGIALSFDLPSCPDPLGVYERMGIALAYLRSQLGGKPQTPEGLELDQEGLEESAGALAFLVNDMTEAGIVPGSPEALRLF
jgi:hypothetical protein